MNTLLLSAALALGQTNADVIAPRSTALDGVWTVVAMEVNGRPSTLRESERALAIRNNTFTLPGLAAMNGTMRLELGPKGTLLAAPAALGTGNQRDPLRGAPPDTGTNPPGTSGTGVTGGANGVYVRTADYLVLTIGDPSAATATGTGTGPTTSAAGNSTVATVGQPPVSLVLRRSTGADAPPSTAATPPPPAPSNPPTLPPGGATMAGSAPAMRMSSVVGSNVSLSDGSSAGTISDLVYGPGGAIDYVALSNNGALSAVPWGALNWNASGLATLPLTAAQFGTIPTFAANDWSNMLANADFSPQLQNRFMNFQGPNGQPLFSQLGNNAMNPMGNRAGNPAGVQPGAQRGVPPGTQRGGQPPTPPRGGGQPPTPPRGGGGGGTRGGGGGG